MTRVGWIALLLVTAAGQAQAQRAPADSLWAAGDHAAAERLYAARLVADSNDVVALQRVATVRAWGRDYATSLVLLDRAARLAPDDADVALLRARVLGWARQYDRAQAVYQGLLQAKPGDREATLGLAQLLTWRERFDSAEAMYRGLLARDARDLDALKGLARAGSARGDLPGAERLWRQVVAAAPGDVEGLAGLGSNLRWQGQEIAALGLLRRAWQLDPTNADVRVQLDQADAAVAPRLSPTYVHEQDSDGNVMRTLSATGAYRVRERIELVADGYRRSLGTTFGGETLDAISLGGSAGLRVVTPGQWIVRGLVGVSKARGDSLDPIVQVRTSLASPMAGRVRGALSYVRSALDYTALLAVRQIRTSEVAADAATRLTPRWTVSATGSATTFIGRESNRRLSGGVATTYRAAPSLTVGAAVRALAFAKDRTELVEGYYNPSFLSAAELTAGLYHDVGRITLSGDAGAGVQRGDGVRGAAVRAIGRVARNFGPAGQLGVSAAFANSGLQRLSGREGGAYRYHAFSLFATHAF